MLKLGLNLCPHPQSALKVHAKEEKRPCSSLTKIISTYDGSYFPEYLIFFILFYRKNLKSQAGSLKEQVKNLTMKKILLLITLLAVVSDTYSQQTIRTTKTGYHSGKGHIQQQTAANDTTPVFAVDGKIALHSLMSISDAHLTKLADALKILAATDAARFGDWEQIRAPFAEVARMNLPAVYWFAWRDGTYRTLDQGQVTTKLSDREYFPRLLAGQTVIGELVVSHSTNRNTAIVAVPVRGSDNSIVGALGCSVHLDSMSALIRYEMGVLENGLFFYSFDAKPLVALHADPTIIFIEPMKQEDEGLQQAFREMLSGSEGMVKYIFRGVRRTVLYCKSPVTGWWYGFGKMEP